MLRKRKRTVRRGAVCVLICIMMVAGTVFPEALEQSPDVNTSGQSVESTEENAGAAGGQTGEYADSGEGETEAAESDASVISDADAAGEPASGDADATDASDAADAETEQGESAASDAPDDAYAQEISGTAEALDTSDTADSSGGTEEMAGDDENEAGDALNVPEGADISWYDSTKSSYTIETAEQLAGFAYLVNIGKTTFSNTTLTLAADVDLSGITWEPVGFSKQYFFAGVFDGGGHAVKNMTVSGSSTYSGLFGYLTGSVINLDIEDAAVTYDGSVSGAGAVYAGIVAGYSSGSITDVQAGGSVSVGGEYSPDTVFAGGVAGDIDGSVKGAVSSAAVTVTAESAGTAYCGGVAGRIAGESGTVLNCGNRGAVSVTGTGTAYAGGLAGLTTRTSVKNCYNAASVKAAAGKSSSYAGGLFGAMGDGELYNCYDGSRQIDGTDAYEGWIAGFLTGSGSVTCDYVYWPGNSSYNSNATYGMDSAALATEITCMGITNVKKKYTSLANALNKRPLADYDESADDNLYMWSVPDGESADAPGFRYDALYPVFPTAPQISLEQTEASLHARADVQDDDTESTEDTAVTEDGEYRYTIKASVVNTDSAVTHKYRWQKLSDDGETYSNISGSDASGESYAVTAGEPGVEYYRLRVTCSADYADASKVFYSEPVKITTGWKISLVDGGMADGSAAVSGATLPDELFPVLPGSGTVNPGSAVSAGNYFLGWSADYEEGSAVPEESIITEFDTTDMSGDAVLYAIFRKAGTMKFVLESGADDAVLNEGVDAESLTSYIDEGAQFEMPDGSAYFTRDGWRFTGWTVSISDEQSGDADSDADTGTDTNSDAGSGTDTDADTGTDTDSDAGPDADTGTDTDTDTGSNAGDDEQTADETVYKTGDLYVAGVGTATLTAVWSKLYNVSFDKGVSYSGSSGTELVTGDLPAAFQAIEGEELTMPSGDGLSYDGYVFRYWKISYKDSDGKEQKSYRGAGASYTMPAADITVSAQWGKLVKVTFYKQLAGERYDITGEVPETIECVAGSSVQMPECDLKYEGYIFAGWYEDQYDYVYQAGEYMGVGQNGVNCYPTWLREHELIFECGTIEGGGTITGEAPESIIIGDGKSVTLPENPFTPPDAEEGYYYRFVGWRLSGGAVYAAGKSFTASSEEREIKFEAVWKKTVIWTGEPAEEFSGGDGTEDAPYEIATAGELAKLTTDIAEGETTYDDTYFKLTDDIDLNQMLWTPIGIDEDNCFEGIFNGCGYTVSGLSLDSVDQLYCGLFGYAKDAEIINLELENVDIETNWAYSIPYGSDGFCTGAVVGMLNGGVLSGCSVSGSVEGNYSGYKTVWGEQFYSNVGGIAGAVGGNTEVTGCENNAYIGGESMCAGGIVGLVIDSASKPAVITGCVNYGTIDNSYKVNVAGGIVGRMPYGSISGCVNEGKITAENWSAWLGGIAGISGAGISDCDNTGEVCISAAARNETFSGFCPVYSVNGVKYSSALPFMSDAVSLGGITGFFSGETLEECTNTGSVTLDYETCNLGSTLDGDVPGTAGGITGMLYASEITDCLNSASVTASNSTSKTHVYGDYDMYFERPTLAGGIAGTVLMKSTISYCCNTGRVIAEWQRSSSENPSESGLILGGVNDRDWGDSSGKATIVSCYAKGSTDTDETDESSVQGIAGERYSSYCSIKNSAAKTEEQFASGEVAYLLGYSGLKNTSSGITGDSERSDRNAWTQSDGMPALGSPSVVPARVSGTYEGGSVTLGNDDCSGLSVLYAVPESTVYVSAEADDMTQTVTEYTKTEETDSGTWYYTYRDTTVGGFTGITVEYRVGDGENEPETLDGTVFAMKDCDEAVVGVISGEETTTVKISETFVPKEVEEPEPSPGDGGSGSGGGKGSGNGKGTGDGNQDGTGDGNGGNGDNPDGNPNGVPGGTGDADAVATNGSPTTSPSLSSTTAVVNSNADIIVTEPVPEVTELDTSEPAPASEADSGGGGETETTPESEQEVTVFEVVRDTVKDNLFTTLLLLLLILILAAAGAYNRYRKNRDM